MRFNHIKIPQAYSSFSTSSTPQGKAQYSYETKHLWFKMDSGHTQKFSFPSRQYSLRGWFYTNRQKYLSMPQIEVLDVWGLIPGTVRDHVKDCHGLIKDTAAEKGRLTLQSYLHNFQPEGSGVEPQWGHFYLQPKGTCIKATGVNESLCSMTEEKTPILQLSWCRIYVWCFWNLHQKTQLLLIYYDYLHFTVHSIRRRTFWGKDDKLCRQKVVIQKLQNFSFQK